MNNFVQQLLLKALAKDSGNYSPRANSKLPSQALATADKRQISAARGCVNAFKRDAEQQKGVGQRLGPLSSSASGAARSRGAAVWCYSAVQAERRPGAHSRGDRR